MLQSVSNGMCKVVKKVVPSPYVLAIFLTLLTFLLGWILTPSTFINMCNYMGAGMFSLLSFTMQMVLVLVTGHILANAPIVKKWLIALAHLPRSRTQAIMMVGVIGFLATYINWGFGLVVGAIIAKEVAKSMHGNHVHYPLLIAVAYAGNIARGPSSAIAIAPASADSIVYDFVGVVPVSQSLFSTWNLLITAIVLLVSMIMFTRMQPSEENAIEISLSAFGEDSKPAGSVVPKNKDAGSFAAKLDNNMLLAYIPAIIVIIYLVSYFYTNKSLNFDLNIVIAIFFALGALAHKTPGAYSRAMRSHQVRCGHYATVHVLCSHHRYDEELRSGCDAGRFLCECRFGQDAAHVHLPECRNSEHLHSFRRRPVGRTGPHHAGRLCPSGRGSRPRHYGAVLGRLLDEPDPALLGTARAGNRRSGRAGYHGLLHDLRRCDRHHSLCLLPGIIR